MAACPPKKGWKKPDHLPSINFQGQNHHSRRRGRAKNHPKWSTVKQCFGTQMFYLFLEMGICLRFHFLIFAGSFFGGKKWQYFLDGCVMTFLFWTNELLVPACIGTNRYTIPKTNSPPLKMDGWNTIYLPFGASKGLFAGAFAVGFREGKDLVGFFRGQFWWDSQGKTVDENIRMKVDGTWVQQGIYRIYSNLW